MKSKQEYDNLYEYRRENLYLDANPLYQQGDPPCQGKHFSYFKKKEDRLPHITLCTTEAPETSYDVCCNLSDVVTWVRKKTSQKAFKELLEVREDLKYLVGSLELYLDQCRKEGYSKCILSKREFATVFVKPRKPRKSNK